MRTEIYQVSSRSQNIENTDTVALVLGIVYVVLHDTGIAISRIDAELFKFNLSWVMSLKVRFMGWFMS